MGNPSSLALNGPMTNNMQEKSTILVLGGTGKIGRRVVERLTDRAVSTRLGSRSARPAFDWDDPATWAAAVRDVDAVFVSYQPDLAFPGAADTVAAFVDRAMASDVGRLVLLSGRNEDGALLAERAVQQSGAAWTIVRSSFFAQNFSESFFVDAVRSGVVAFPAGNVAEPFVDADDVADVAVAALIGDTHDGQLYEVTGPRLLTFAEAVRKIAEASGTKVDYLPVSGAAYASALRAEGLDADFAADLTELFTTVLDGRSAYVTDGVQRALGRGPRDFADYARTAAATGVWDPQLDRVPG